MILCPSSVFIPFTGAGFYVDATQRPWSAHYNMFSYINKELPNVIASNFDVDMERCGVFGHSMGGHGALVSGLRNSGLFKVSLSNFVGLL